MLCYSVTLSWDLQLTDPALIQAKKTSSVCWANQMKGAPCTLLPPEPAELTLMCRDRRRTPQPEEMTNRKSDQCDTVFSILLCIPQLHLCLTLLLRKCGSYGELSAILCDCASPCNITKWQSCHVSLVSNNRQLDTLGTQLRNCMKRKVMMEEFMPVMFTVELTVLVHGGFPSHLYLTVTVQTAAYH